MSVLCKVALALDGEKNSYIRFGNMKYVRIFELSDSDEISELGEKQIPDINEFKSKDEFACHGKNEEFLNALGELLSDCKYLIVGESGGYPSRVLLRHGISVLEQQDDIETLLTKLISYEEKR
jgi:hypothetical protein